MLPPFEAILFDYDGTLAVLNLDFAAMRQQLHTFTIAQGISPQELHDLDILEMLEWATGWLRQHSPEQADRYARDAEQLIQDMEVQAAHSSGLLPGAAVRVTFPHIDTYCQAFMPRNRVTQVKPHPAHLQAALDCLGTSPERAIMVGDGAMDIQAGKALGMFSIGVLSGNSSRTKLLAHGADLVLASVVDLLQYIDRQSRAV